MRPRFSLPHRWLFAGLLLLVAVNVWQNPAYLRITIQDGHLYGTPVDIVSQGARSMVLALGMMLVIATGGVDLSVGSVVAIVGAVCALLLGRGCGLAVTLGAALATGLAAGAVNGLLVARLRMQPIVATLILMVAGRGVAQLLSEGQVIIISHAGFEFLASGYFLGLPVAPLLAGGLFGAMHLLMRRTAAGLLLEAVGVSETAARFAGIPTPRFRFLCYMICGACAAAGGVLTAANIRAADANRAGENAELDAIFAVVVGGTALTGGRFSIFGTFLGVLLIQTLTTTMYNIGVPPTVAPVPKALLIIAVSLLQSEKARQFLARAWRQTAPVSP